MLADGSFSFPLQMLLLALAALAFMGAFVWAMPFLRGSDGATRGDRWPVARSAIIAGVVLCVIVLVWRAIDERALALPLYNYLDAFIVLALLLTGLLVYFRWTQYFKGLSLFLLPMIAGLLVLGGVLDALHRGEFHDAAAWTYVHLIAVILGSACFAAGCVCGAAYLLVDRQLHKKGLAPSHRWIGLPPLASMERFMRRAIFLGFPLLTIAILAGIMRILQQPELMGHLWTSPKVLLAAAAWIIYGLMLHVKWTPAFRGTRAAWLSIIGFALVMAVFLIVNLMPKGG